MMLIGFTGPMGHGKSECAKFLAEDMEFIRLSMADPLRWCMHALNPIVGSRSYTNALTVNVTYCEAIERHGYNEAKRKYPEIRRLLQVIGTEVGREILGEYVGNPWIQIARDRISGMGFTRPEKTDEYGIHWPDDPETADIPGEIGGACFDDIRFKDEGKLIHNYGGIVVEVIDPRKEVDKSHRSEHGIPRHLIHETIINDKGIPELHEAVRDIVSQQLIRCQDTC